MVPLINRSIMLLLGFPSNNISFSAFMLTEKQRWMCVCVHRQAEKNYIKEIQRLQTRALKREEMLTLRCLWNLNSAPLLLIFVAFI